MKAIAGTSVAFAWVAFVGLEPEPSAAPCTVEAVATDAWIQIAPRGSRPFDVRLKAEGHLAITIGPASVPTVDVRTGHLAFSGGGSRLEYHVVATTDAGKGIIRLAPLVLLAELAAGPNDTVIADLHPSDELTIRRVALPCSSVTAGTRHATDDWVPRTFEGEDFATPRGRRLLLSSAPGAGASVRVDLEDPRNRGLQVLARRPGWTRVFLSDDSVELLGWARSSTLRPETFLRASGHGGIGCCAARVSPPGAAHYHAKLARGAGIFAGAGLGRWATVEAPVEAIVETVGEPAGEAPWAEIIEIPDIDGGCRLEQAWVKTTDLGAMARVEATAKSIEHHDTAAPSRRPMP